MRKTPTTLDVEIIDAQELVTSIEKASTIFGTGCVAFCDLRSVFEAIATVSQAGTLAKRLANLGQTLCESHEIEFDHQQAAFDADAERFTTSLGIPLEVNHG